MDGYVLTVFLIFCTLALASVVRTTAGFGFSLVAVPPLSLLTDPVTAVITAIFMAGPLSIWIALKDRHHIDRRIATTAVLACIAGVPVGVWILNILSAQALTIAIAVVVLACTALVWKRVVISGGLPVVAGISAFSGISFASTGIDGPPMVAAMQGMRLEPRVQRATLAVVFATTSVCSVIGFGVSGQLTGDLITTLAVGVPAFGVGIVAGEYLFSRFNAERFRQAVLGLLIVSSVSVISSVLTA